MMQAIVQNSYGSAEVLELRDIHPPEIGDDEVLVRVRAAGMEPGVWHLMTGLPYLVRIMGYGFRAPKNPVRGSDVAGRVEAVGDNVTRFKPGDDVFGVCDGSFAELAAVREKNLAHTPANLDFEHAAVVPISALTALQGLRDHGTIAAGQRVLIIGAAGGVGSFAVQLAKTLGAEVTGVCSTLKVELVHRLGADNVIDYTREDFTKTDAHYDLILDTAGARPVSSLRQVLTTRGTLVIVGAEGGNRWTGGIGRQIRAVMLSPFVRHNLRMFIAESNAEDLLFIKELIEARRVTPLFDRAFPLSQTPEAVRYWEEGRARGKIAITV